MWGVDKGKLGSGWDGAHRATREHTVLNYSKTKGVQHRCCPLTYCGVVGLFYLLTRSLFTRHRCCQLTYCGRQLLLRHVVWLPEGLVPRSLSL